ncbi:hypothetical protein ACFU6K_09365 [Kitasatospora sp. NPDC057512]|uniref:hypothetical protein n=1 Tax=Kitasatospora sp. NPDC057512 TaxID=3346154 RepID=UPI003673C939
MTTEPAEPVPAAPAPASGPAGPAVPPPPAAPPVAPEAFASETGVPEAVAPKAPRRPRPVLLTACALVLGTLAGGGVGYAVQAQRPPTPLPPLQAARPAYPAERVDPAALAAEQPAPLGIDGDLTKLLIGAPEGSTPWGERPDKPSWISIGELAEQRSGAADTFKDLASRGFRRAAQVNWKKDGVFYRVQLVQFTEDRADEAKSGYWPLPFAENANGGYKVDIVPTHWAESTEQYYYGGAHAKRGSVEMTIEVLDTKPANPDTLKDLAKRQWERLG